MEASDVDEFVCPQPPLPEEDYPVSPSHGGNKKDEDDVFTVVRNARAHTNTHTHT